jgi:hypothetical protein
MVVSWDIYSKYYRANIKNQSDSISYDTVSVMYEPTEEYKY